MTKPIVLIGDIHQMDKAPSGRTDTYPQDILAKLEWTVEYANEIGACTVWAGDIFSHKQPSRTSHSTVMAMLDVAKSYDELWIVDGNHDMSSDRIESVMEKQPLGVLYHAGIRRLDGWHPDLPIFGVPWQQRWLDEDTPMEAFELWRSAGGVGEGPETAVIDLNNALAITHAPIYPPSTRDEQMFELVPTAGEHGLSEAMGHMGSLYYGHIHEDHGFWEDEGVTYGNVGALSRGSLHEYNLERKVQLAVWEKGKGFRAVEIPHKPAAEVFRIETARAAATEKKNLDSFLTEIGNSTLDISSTESVIEHVRGMSVPPPVKKTAIEILTEVG